MLVAQSSDGCYDTVMHRVINTPATTIFIPASFTPNGDGLNDVFYIQGDALDQAGFEFQIWDRWGQSMFYSKNPTYGWDGRSRIDGLLVPAGSYPYIVRYIDRYNEPRTISGHVIVSKTGTADLSR